MSTNNEPEPEQPPFCREIPAALEEQLRRIALNEAFAPEATLQTAYDQVRTLAMAILNSPEAAPTWRLDDAEEQLAAARRVSNRLATLEGPPRPRTERVSDPPTFDGSREKLEGFVAVLRIKLFSDPSRFPTPALRMGYTFNRLEGRAQAQILPFVQNRTFQLDDSDDIIRILKAAFSNPDPAATARTKLLSLKQGKKEFTAYFAEFQMLVSKLNWGEHAKLDALKEGVSIELRRQLVGRTQGLSFDQFVGLCQQLDSEIRALQLQEGRHHTSRQNQPRSQNTSPQQRIRARLPQVQWTSVRVEKSSQNRNVQPDLGKAAACTAEDWATWPRNAPTRAATRSVPLRPWFPTPNPLLPRERPRNTTGTRTAAVAMPPRREKPRPAAA